MSNYNELVAGGDHPDKTSGDPRAAFVSFNFIVVSLSSSLFVFLLMERFSASSFLVLVHELSIFNVITAVALFCILCFASISVVSVWIRNRRLLVLSTILAVMFAWILALALVWAPLLNHGTYETDLEAGFHRLNNNSDGVYAKCPTVGDAKCCGWATACAASDNCSHAHKLCVDVIKQNIYDYVVRVIPIVSIILGFHLLSVGCACFSRTWRMSIIQANPTTADTDQRQ